MAGRIKPAAAKRRRDLEMTSLLVAGKLPSHRMRIAALRKWGASIGDGATFYHGFEVRNASGLRVGPRSSIGNDAILDARGGLTIGHDVNLSTAVQIWTGQHDWQSGSFAYEKAPVTIGDPSSTSSNARAAGAVVSRDVEPYTLVGGVPAKKLGDRPSPMTYELAPAHDKPWWW